MNTTDRDSLKLVELTFFGRAMLVVRFALPGPEFFWWIQDGEYLYTSIFGVHIASKPGLCGLQFIAGPLNCIFAWSTHP